jgi:3-deoxy-D-manno-octulosonate 8-phosphate phosphatase (KDO 8-P phosphatase)
MNVLSQFHRIKLFVFDMDGVLTNGEMLIEPDGNWLRRMSVKDGYALQLAIKSGYMVVVVSGSDSKPIYDRLHKLGVTEVFMNVTNKEKFLQEYIAKNNWQPQQILCMGDDIPDFNFMQLGGLACCPADAVIEIKKICSYISPLKGGEGCARDVIEKVLKLNNHWPLDTTIPAT